MSNIVDEEAFDRLAAHLTNSAGRGSASRIDPIAA
jgi:hypothetical protein